MSSNRPEIDEMVSQQVEANKTPTCLPMERNKMPSDTIEIEKLPDHMQPEKVPSVTTETYKTPDRTEPET